MKPVAPEFRRLLLIDDEPGIRRMMALDLAADGYQVTTAADGAGGMRAFETTRPPLVITDLKMPGMDGLEVLERIKALAPETEVIVITGHGEMELAIRSLRLMASDFITKPINADALEVALDRAAERLELRQKLRRHQAELEQRVREATEQARASERLAAVGRTVAALVHSLKNMLTGLKGGAYLVRQGQTEPGLAMLERNLARAGALVKNLLAISRPRRPEPQPLSVAELWDEVTAVMAAAAREKGVALAREAIAPGLVLWADREMLTDALCNLVGNGIDAAAEGNPGGGGRVRVGAGLSGGQVVLRVEDNGPGLAEEAAGHLFEGFFTTKGAAGTGLGLMVAAKVAGEHGGRVEYASRPGRGAEFRLVLPAKPAAELEGAGTPETGDGRAAAAAAAEPAGEDQA